MTNTVKSRATTNVNMNLGKKINTNDFHMILFTIFYAFLFVFTDFGIDVAYGVILLTIAEFVYFAVNFKRLLRFRLEGTSCIVYFLALAVIILNFRSGIFISQVPLYIYGMVLVTLSIPFNDSAPEVRRRVLNIILFAAFINALVVYFSKAAPNIYLNMVSGFSLSRYERLVHMLQEGYSGYLVQESYALSMMIMGCCICALKLRDGKKRTSKKTLLWFSFLFLALAIILVNRRGELLAAIGAGVITIFVVGKKRTKRIIITLAVALLLSLLPIIIVIRAGSVSYHGNSRILRTFIELINGEDVSNGRIELCEAAWTLFKENPFFGIGWGEFRRYSVEVLNTTSNVHCIYLQILCETGIMGAIILYFVLGYTFYWFYRNYKCAKTSFQKQSCIFALFVFIFILIHGLIDNPIYYDTFWFTFGILIFCSYRTRRKEVS